MAEENKKQRIRKAVTAPADAHFPTFRRKARKHYVRYFYLLVLLFLNISFLMSMVERVQRHLYVDFGSEAFLLVFIFGLDILMLPSLLFEVNGLVVKDEAVAIDTMFGRKTIPYSEIVSLTMPKYLVWAIVRTKRGFYLINRKDIPDFEQLHALLAPRLPSAAV